MKKLIILLALCPTISLAQPTITGNVFPSIGKTSTFRLFNAQTTAPGDSGINVTWDYSNLTGNGTGLYEYKDPSTMSLGSTFSAANLGVVQNGDPSVYLLANSNEITQIGLDFMGITENYNSDPKELIQFPITYGSVFTETFSGSAVVGTFNVNRSGQIEIVGDAYGTLILPYASYSNVLRVRTISTYTDKFLSNTVNEGVDTVYTWYMDGVNELLFNWYHLTGTQIPSSYYGAYLDTAFVGVNEIIENLLGLTLSPNPARQEVSLTFTNPEAGNVQMNIHNVMGDLVYEIQEYAIKGKVEKRICLRDFKPGMYYVTLQSREGRSIKRLLVR